MISLNFVGSDGINVLESQGLDLNSKTVEDYRMAIKCLGYYDKKKREHVA